MAINRFSQGPIEADVQSTFMPLPIDLISQQGERMQSNYDTAKAFIGASQDAYYGAKGLTPDTESLRNITSAYDTDIESKIKEVGGDYGKLKGYSDALGQKVKKDMMTGQLGAIHNNYAAAMNHMEELKKSKEKGDISEAGYNKGLASISGFGGTVEDGKGGYTRASLYTPTRFVEAGKLADDYGKVLADQFDAKGQKFKNAKTASELIERNLWNNPEIMANAKEQVWATYGDLPPDKEHIAVSAYLKNIAQSAGYKVAYHEVFKPTEDASGNDRLFGATAIGVDMQGAKPLRGMFNMEGTNFWDELSNAENITTRGKLASIAMGIPASVLVGSGGISYGGNGKDNDIREKEQARILLEANTKAKESLNRLSKSPMVQDIAKAFKIDLSNPNLETVQKLQKAMEDMNSSSASTRVMFYQDDKGEKQFEYLMNSGLLTNMRVTDAVSGKELSGKEKEKVYTEYLNSDKKGGEGSTFYGGSILTPAQPYPIGTMAISRNVGGEPQKLLIDLAQNEGTKEFFLDRAAAAYNSGASWYKVGNTTYQFLKMPDTGLVKAYVDGKPATDARGNVLPPYQFYNE